MSRARKEELETQKPNDKELKMTKRDKTTKKAVREKEEKAKKGKKQTIYNTLTTRGSIRILFLMYDIWLDWKKQKRSRSTTAKYIGNKCNLSTRPLRRALESLMHFGLIRNIKTKPTVSDLGIYLCSLLREIQTVSMIERKTRDFDEKKDPQDWVKWALNIIIGAKSDGELLITTRWLTSFQDPIKRNSFTAAFQDAAARGVTIKMIADLKFPKETCNHFKQACNNEADIRYIPCNILEMPPEVLRPKFLDDFSHVMIADRTNWLYISPHKKGELHTGKITHNDQIIATYLANVFECFWILAMPRSLEKRTH